MIGVGVGVGVGIEIGAEVEVESAYVWMVWFVIFPAMTHAMWFVVGCELVKGTVMVTQQLIEW